MEIHGIPSENNSHVNGLSGKNNRKVSSVNLSKRTDSVEISGLSISNEKVYEASIVKTEFEPRIELIESVSKRISDGEYNTRDMIMNIAEKIVDADVIMDIITDEFESRARGIKVETANSNVETDNYSDPNIIREVANRIINVIDFSGLFGNDSNS